MSRLTRFYLAKTDKQHYSEAFIVFYLNSHPGDHEVAENWLRQSRAGEGLETQFHDTAARIGEALQNNKTIQQLLAQLYLSENPCESQGKSPGHSPPRPVNPHF